MPLSLKSFFVDRQVARNLIRRWQARDAQRTLKQRLYIYTGLAAAPAAVAVALELAAFSSASNAALRSALASAIVMTALSIFALALVIKGALATIAKPIEDAIEAAKHVATGDLTTAIAVDRKDELGQLQLALYEMNHSLTGVVTQVRQSTQDINSNTADIAQGNADLAERTDKQAARLGTIVTRINAISGAIAQTTDSARNAADLARGAASTAEESFQVFEDVVSTMKGVRDSSKRVFDVIGEIESIAFQTNVLAINAAVESARAGEQGRGFAVVAQEVRQLAARSAKTAKQVKQMIGGSFADINVGADLVTQTSGEMRGLLEAVRAVTDATQTILAACEQQRGDIADVSEAVKELDEVTQQNTELVQESADASDHMRKKTNELAEMVRHFKLLREPRFNVSFKTPCQRDGAPFEATVRNMSASGVYLETEMQAKTGDAILLELPLQLGERTAHALVEGQIARIVALASSDMHGYGLQFSRIRLEDKQALQDFLAAMLADNDAEAAAIQRSRTHIGHLRALDEQTARTELASALESSRRSAA